MFPYFFGMSLLWWVFWVALIAVLWALIVPVPRGAWRERRETPLDILARRYASGELTTAEYEERRMRLERHAGAAVQATRPPPPEARPPGEPPGAHVH